MDRELAAILAQVRLELAGKWPMPRKKVHVPGYSREAGRRALPEDASRFRHITRHL